MTTPSTTAPTSPGSAAQPGPITPSADDAARRIVAACEAHWAAHASDCSAFVRAVAADLGITLSGNADDITDTIRGTGWRQLADGAEAAREADAGRFVIGGLRGSDHRPPRQHGHVVVVVGGPPAHGIYPRAYWGALGSVGRKNETVNWAWTKDDRDRVHYASRPL